AAMGRRYALADFEKKAEPFRHRQSGGIIGDPFSIDQLGNDVCQGLAGGSGFEQSHDIGMFQAGHRLNLTLEAAKDLLGMRKEIEDLDCDLLFEEVVGAA